ncbi:hypothetical protein [Bacillus sp. E(2018)]|uniref:hypothetical protein n=1 Tax=Bacillus sp. E(2018) TaxID=2502239 RepID=UPI0010FA13A1|nr:hypothetical protein [Bacillus sp. E(2018)]
MNLIELNKIEESLKLNEISYVEAGELIYGSTTKPWQTEDWRKKRNEMIKDSCESCNSSKPPMVIQHMWHPTPYKQNVNEVFEEYLKEELMNNSLPTVNDQEVQEYLDQFSEQREACPSCEMRSISKRKTMKPANKCVKCKHEFDEPKMLAYHPKLGVAPSFNSVKNGMRHGKLRDLVWNNLEATIRKRAILKSIADHKRYMSMIDTKTFCKRCAFLWDKKRKKVCGICKVNLTSITMHACFNCLE